MGTKDEQAMQELDNRQQYLYDNSRDPKENMFWKEPEMNSRFACCEFPRYQQRQLLCKDSV